MTRVAEGFQIGASAISWDVVQVGHRYQPAPGGGFEVSHHRALIGVVGGANAIAEFLDRFTGANSGPPAELTAPVDLGLYPAGDRIPVRRVKLAIHRHGSTSLIHRLQVVEQQN